MEIGGLRADVYSSISGIAARAVQESNQRMIEDIQRLAEGEISPELMVDVIKESFIYSLNIKLLKITDEMAGQIVNLLA